MPKITTAGFTRESLTGEKVCFNSDVSVDSSGVFSFTLPASIADHAGEYKSATGAKWLALNVQGSVTSRGERRRVVHGSVYADVHKFINEVIDDYPRVETQVEMTIAYRYVSGMQYWVNPDGSIAPNGGVVLGGDPWGHWCGITDNRRNNPAGISLAAVVLEKKTHTRGAVTTVEYVYWRPERNAQTTDPRCMLNAINQGAVGELVGTSSEESFCPAKWSFMPYSDKAALFFYQMALSLCRVDQVLTKFLCNKSEVEKAIDTGSSIKLLQ